MAREQRIKENAGREAAKNNKWGKKTKSLKYSNRQSTIDTIEQKQKAKEQRIKENADREAVKKQ